MTRGRLDSAAFFNKRKSSESPDPIFKKGTFRSRRNSKDGCKKISYYKYFYETNVDSSIYILTISFGDAEKAKSKLLAYNSRA